MIFVPPIKIQGIKTKLIPFIRENISLHPNDLWIEPFMGSGVVGFNLAPTQAIFSDLNPHIINFYNALKNKVFTHHDVRNFLSTEGVKLQKEGESYYKEVRNRFNQHHNPLDFLFLNRSCFNGMIRFNKRGAFNVPYGHKDGRFAKAYITKIVNQVKWVERKIAASDWSFTCQSYRDSLVEARHYENSFIYCDPPYIGRHVDYYDSWDIQNELELRDLLNSCGYPYMVSTWDHNQYRKNDCLDSVWANCEKINKDHYYYIGAREANRNAMVEALLMNYQPPQPKDIEPEFCQLDLAL